MDQRLTSDPGDRGRGFHLDAHLCLDLLQGLASDTQRERSLSHLEACPECERLFQEWAAKAERLRTRGIIRTLPDGEIVLDRFETTVRAQEKGRCLRHSVRQAWLGARETLRHRGFQLAGGLAVAAVILLLVVRPHDGGSPVSPDLHMLPSYSFQLQTREVPDDIRGGQLSHGLQAYDRKDFKRAVRLLQGASDVTLSEVHEIVRKIYLGSALAWSGRYDEAAELLEKVPLMLLPGDWSTEAQWTLYVALRESGEGARADSLLHIMARTPDGIGQRARRLLEREGLN